jgi:GDP-4-dehydro-6-deoxy-D-mannose reductase
MAQEADADVVADVRDRDAVLNAFSSTRPDSVVHLAAVAYVPQANANPDETDAVNRGGTINVLDAAREVGASTLFVSSAAVYGRVPEAGMPITESRALEPNDVYGASKVAGERECEARAGEQAIVRARPFNHTGPGQSPDYVCSDFARQLALAEAGLGPRRIEVGELRAERDFSDVRDVARAYVAMLESARAGEVYNVCSGVPVTIAHVLDTLLDAARVPVEVQIERRRLRPGEVNRYYGSYQRLHDTTGWQPQIDLQTTLSDLLEDWRLRIAAEPGLARR